jgi:hypothetical protein
MKAEESQVATAIEIYKTDHAGRTPISVWSEQNYIDPNIKTGQLYNEGTPEYTEIMNKLVEGGYLSAVPKSPDTTSYAYGESTDGTQAIFATRLKSGSNISSNTKKSCDFIEPVAPPPPIEVEYLPCVQGRIPIAIPSPAYYECKYNNPSISSEDLPGPTSISTIVNPASWDCGNVPLNNANMNCWESGEAAPFPEPCGIQDYTITFPDEGPYPKFYCPAPEPSKAYSCVGTYTNPPPCDSVPVEEGYVCENISEEIYEVCPINQGGGDTNTDTNTNLCAGTSNSDYCTCI